MCATRAMLLVLGAGLCAGSDLSYPAPANPFAAPGAPGVPPPPGVPQAAGQPLPPPPVGGGGLLPGGGGAPLPGGAYNGILPGGGDEGLLPGGGGDDDLLPGGSGGGGGNAGGNAGGMLPGFAGDGPGSAGPTFGAPSPGGDPLSAAGAGGASRSAPAAKRRGGPLARLRPTLCLAALSFACVRTKPRAASLLTALDTHFDEWGELLEVMGEARDAPLVVRDCGLGCVSKHGGLVWLGMLGQWLPLLPSSADGLELWMGAVGAPQLLVLALTLGCFVRLLLPVRVGAAHLSSSLDGLRRGRVYTLLTSSLSPVGLVHLLHAAVVILACTADLGDLGRQATLGFYAAAGAAAAVLQALLGGRSRPRTAVSGAVTGLLLLRTATLPDVALSVGGEWELKPLRAVAVHLALDLASNSASLGFEKLLGMMGAALVVAAARPQLRESVLDAVQHADGWQGVLELLKGAL